MCRVSDKGKGLALGEGGNGLTLDSGSPPIAHETREASPIDPRLESESSEWGHLRSNESVLGLNLKPERAKIMACPYNTMLLGGWLRMLRTFWGELCFSPSICLTLLLVTLCTCLTSMASFFENLFVWWTSGFREFKGNDRPVFILGHYRSGTTLLHNMLVLDDEQFSYSSNLQCLFPCNFRVMRRVGPAIQCMLPKTRPMDDVSLNLDLPQEDEYAMMIATGGISPFLQFFFSQKSQQERLSKFLTFELCQERPSDPGHDVEDDVENSQAGTAACDPDDVEALKKWKSTWLTFLKKVAYDNHTRHGAGKKRLALKSPSHTARIPLLLEAFPNAQFIFVHRDPYEVWNSTVAMVGAVNPICRLTEVPTEEDVASYVINQYKDMNRAYRETRHLIPEENLAEVKYRDLVDSPLLAMDEIYTKLRMGNPPIKELAAYVEEQHRGFKKKKPRDLDDRVVRLLNKEWAEEFRSLGYTPRKVSSDTDGSSSSSGS
ncbi:unnamed protein product [Chrysoparadoxa australica]